MANLNRLPIVPPGNPTLDLNFMARTALIQDVAGAPGRSIALDSLGTFTVASAVWGVGPDGLLGRVEANVLRFVSNPSTRAQRGVQSESASTNLMLWSSNFDQAAWVKTGVTLFSGSVTGIDGQNSGTRLADTGISSTIGTLAQTIAAAAAWNGAGVYLRRPDVITPSQWRLRGMLNGGSSALAGNAVADLATGVLVGAPTSVVARATGGPLGYVHIQASINNTVGATSITWQLERANGADTGAAVDLSYAQGEARLGLTSPIPMQGAAVTRAKDQWSIPIGPWLNVQEGAIYAEFTPNGDYVNADQFVCLLRNADATSNLSLRRSRFGPAVVGSSSSGASCVMYGADNGTDQRAAFAWNGSGFASTKGASCYINSGVATATGAVPTGLTTLDVGHYNGVLQLDGTLRRLLYRSLRASNTILSDDAR